MHRPACFLFACLLSVGSVFAAPPKDKIMAATVKGGVEADPLWELDVPRKDLDAVLMRFMQAYDGGDINRFMQLFAANVRTDDGAEDSDALRSEYNELFLGTRSRRIILRNVRWARANDGVMAESDFMLSAFSRRDDRPHDKNGAMRFYLTKVGSRWLISEIYFAYDP